MTPRAAEDWDQPHLLPPDAQDPFTMFLCNELRIEWIRSHPHNYSELQVAEARKTLDQNLMGYHLELVQAFLELTPEERIHWRDFVPQLEFWSRGDGIDTTGRRRPIIWPWVPDDAIGDTWL